MFKKVLFPKNPPQLAPNKELCDEDNSNKTFLLHCVLIKQYFLFLVNRFFILFGWRWRVRMRACIWHRIF